MVTGKQSTPLDPQTDRRTHDRIHGTALTGVVEPEEVPEFMNTDRFQVKAIGRWRVRGAPTVTMMDAIE